MSIILKTATRTLAPLIILFSIFILVRGHNEPGGGFIGGMVAGAAIALYLLSHGLPIARRAVPLAPHRAIALGLLLALSSGLAGLVQRGSFMAGIWWDITIGGRHIAVGTPTLFDVGVYLLVAGMTVKILFHLSEED